MNLSHFHKRSNPERRKRKLPAYLTEEEYTTIIGVVKKPHHKLAFNLAFNSGLRISEIIKLKLENIDYAGKKIFIKDAKGGKDRVVPLPKGLPVKYLKLIPIKCGVRALEIAFSNAVKKSGLIKSNLVFHSLRHSFAVRCMERGMPLNHIQTLLGHESIATTSIYLKINPKEALESYEKIW